MRWAVQSLAAALAVALGPGCFSGEATLGALCRVDADCGAGQGCDNAVCGRCGDGSAQPGEVCLQEGEPVALGAGTPAVRARDVDRDGVVDLVTLSAGESQISVFRGGEGSFAAPEVVALPAAARLLAVGDLDGDGTVDAIVAGDASIRIGLGDGTLVFSFGPEALDWPGATSLDLTQAGAGEAGAYLAATRPDGGATRVGAITLGTDGVARITAEQTMSAEVLIATTGELVGDDVQEVIVRATDALIVLSGEGLDEVARIPTLSVVAAVTIVDADGDGHPDLLTGDAAGVVTLHRGDDAGTFVAESVLSFEAPTRVLGFVDLNRDGRRDITAATDEGVKLALANGSRWLSPIELPGGHNAVDLVVAERTTDILPELAVISMAPASVVVLEANP